VTHLLALSSLWLVIVDPFPPFLQLGPLRLHFYGLAYALAFAAGLLFIRKHLAQRGVATALTDHLTFYSIIFGLLGARLYFVAQSDPWWYLTHPLHLLALWEGGMAFFGAIGAVLITLIVLARRHHLNFWLLLDAGVLFAAIGQPIGRIGNILNGEILGPPSNLPWAIAYTSKDSLAPHLGVPYTPANLYEALGTLLILAVLLFLRHRAVPVGVLGLVYLFLYPVSQILLFFYRTDANTPVLLWGLKQAQLTSLVVLLVVLPLFIFAWWRSRRTSPSKLV
jgi:phosphatidylglycerol:prolipoprotein diacylglycerol transferase